MKKGYLKMPIIKPPGDRLPSGGIKECYFPKHFFGIF